tara:strand:+ start:843 stop:1034 length:192 start_codon:yes stop_codon:yes gene_type:complete
VKNKKMEAFRAMLVKGARCPNCGSRMYSSGADVWCEIAAGGDMNACDFNHDHKITLEQFLLDK